LGTRLSFLGLPARGLLPLSLLGLDPLPAELLLAGLLLVGHRPGPLLVGQALLE
jgi:hypothetical protein